VTIDYSGVYIYIADSDYDDNDDDDDDDDDVLTRNKISCNLDRHLGWCDTA